VLPCDAVDSGRRVPFDILKRIPQSFDRHVVEERAESLALIPDCYLSHALQCTGHALFPALFS